MHPIVGCSHWPTMSRCNESKVTSAGSFFNFAGFADHAGQCCSQTLLNKTCCVLFCVLSRRDISHRSFDGDAWIVYRQQRMNVGAKDSPKWEPEQLIAFQSGFRTTVALNQPVHRTFDLFNVSQPFSCQTEMYCLKQIIFAYDIVIFWLTWK